MSPIAWIAAVIIVVLISSVYAVARAAIQTGGFWLSQRSTEQLYHRKCKNCDGCGATLIDGSIIPKEIRTFTTTASGGIVRTKQANTRKCMSCGGMGRIWISESEVRRPNVQDRGMFDQWSN